MSSPRPSEYFFTLNPFKQKELLMIQVGIIMGSNSDWPVMQQAAQFLKEFGVEYEARVVSAHRTPDLMFEYAKPHANAASKPSLPARAAQRICQAWSLPKLRFPSWAFPFPANICAAKTPCFRLCKCPKAFLLLHLPLAKPVQPMQRYLPFHFWPTKILNWLKNWPLSVPNKNKPF